MSEKDFVDLLNAERKELIENLPQVKQLKEELEKFKEDNKRLNELLVSGTESLDYWTNKCLEEQVKNTELQKQVDELKGGKGLFISQDQIDWVCSLGVMVHIDEDSPVVLLNRHRYENTCADIDRRQFHFEEEKEQAVKDTAKGIYKEIGKGDILVVQTQEYGEIEVVSIERLKEIIKSKGVEVE